MQWGGESPVGTPNEIMIRQGSSMDTKTTRRKNVENRHILTVPEDHPTEYTVIVSEKCVYSGDLVAL